MGVIDVDPQVLARSADVSLHASNNAMTHIAAECNDDVPKLIETLTDEGPYAYTEMWRLDVQEDGSFRLPITTTREEIYKGYSELHEVTAVLSWESLVEIRGQWYTFVEGTGTGLDKTSDTFLDGAGTSILLIPSGTGDGITGELVWIRLPTMQLGVGQRAAPSSSSGDEQPARRDLLRRHDQWLDAWRSRDVDAALEALSIDGHGAVRDYVDETGTLVVLEGAEAHRQYLSSFFDKWRIRSVDLLHRVAQEWYLFAEVRITAETENGLQAFHVAEFFVPGHDGRLLVHIGHGTDPAPL